MTVRARAGFTLVELMVAVLVITVGLLATASTMGYLIRLRRDQSVRTEMALIARDKIDEVRLVSATRLPTPVVTGGSIDRATLVTTGLSDFRDVVTRAGRKYRRMWSIGEANVVPGARQVSVRVFLEGDLSPTPIEVVLTVLVPTSD